MNAMPDSNSYCERDNDSADAAWAKIEAAYRDDAVADVADKFTRSIAYEDAGEILARLTRHEWSEMLLAHTRGWDADVGAFFALGLDRWREEYMTSEAGEHAVAERILELSKQENE